MNWFISEVYDVVEPHSPQHARDSKSAKNIWLMFFCLPSKFGEDWTEGVQRKHSQGSAFS